MSERRYDELFEAMIESVGIKAFAADIGLSTRQIHRMLNGVQPNPIRRMAHALAACRGAEAEVALDWLCHGMDGYFVRLPDGLERANVNAVKESAEAIVAISEGRSVRVTVKEIREAISALAALEKRLREGRTAGDSDRRGQAAGWSLQGPGV